MLSRRLLAAASLAAFAAAYGAHTYSENMASSAARALNASLSLAGKRAVVVGGTSGIGHGIALRLAQADASVTIVGRSAERGDAIVAEMKSASSKGEHAFVACDCFSLEDVARCSEVLAAANDPLDLLVLSQGMATTQGFTPTKEGLDQKLTLHVYSRAAFAVNLMPVLERAEEPRVLSVLSGGVHSAYKNWQADPELSGGSYGPKTSADSAGMYNDIILDALAQEHKGVAFSHASPGFVATRWGMEMNVVLRGFIRVLQVFAKSTATCAEYLISGMLAAPKGFTPLDQYGKPATTVAEHAAARDPVWARLRAIVEKKGAVGGPLDGASGAQQQK